MKSPSRTGTGDVPREPPIDGACAVEEKTQRDKGKNNQEKQAGEDREKEKTEERNRR